MKRPRHRRIVLLDGGVAEEAPNGADDLGHAVAGHVGPGGRLVIDPFEHDVALPKLRRFLPWILKPGSLLARKPVDDDIDAAVAIDIVREREEIVGVAVWVEGLGFVEGMPLRKRRAFVPVRSGHEVDVAIAVEVARRRTLGEKPVVELLRGERDDGGLFSRDRPQRRGHTPADCKHHQHASKPFHEFSLRCRQRGRTCPLPAVNAGQTHDNSCVLAA